MNVRRTATTLAVACALIVPATGFGLVRASAAGTAPVVTIDTKAGKDGRRALDKPILVAVTGGVLQSVTGTAAPLGVSSPARAWPVTGAFNDTATGWQSSALVPAHIYRVTVVAVGSDGVTIVTTSAHVRTAPPRHTLTWSVTPSRGSKVGVGMPVVMTLSKSARTRAAKARIERALVVTTSRPVGPASWAWLSDRTLQFRPAKFWPAATTVRVTARLDGVFLGRGTWGVHDTTQTFRVERRQVMNVDGQKHTFVVRRSGTVVRRGGVSLGKPGFSTRSGIKVIMAREVSRRMRSSTIGITSGPNAYDLMVPYAMRVTNTGEFVHGAPWNSHIGVANVSHGCTNLTLNNAIWLYHHSLLGDPVVTTGTSRKTELTSGLGGGWNVSWAWWLQHSALH